MLLASKSRERTTTLPNSVAVLVLTFLRRLRPWLLRAVFPIAPTTAVFSNYPHDVPRETHFSINENPVSTARATTTPDITLVLVTSRTAAKNQHATSCSDKEEPQPTANGHT